jgi:uncharacterized Zn-finger protein
MNVEKHSFLIHNCFYIKRLHTGENLHECCKCGKVFSRKDQLISHQRIHSGQKPYGCNECGKDFGLKSQLIIHQRIHAEEKPYECSKCQKTFNKKSNLMVHQRAQGRNPINVVNSGRPSCSSDRSLYIVH